MLNQEPQSYAPSSSKRESDFIPVRGRIAYVVSHSYPFASHGYAARTHGIATALTQHGHSVITILRPGRPWDVDGFKDDNSPLHHRIDGVTYIHSREPSSRTMSSEEWQISATQELEKIFRLFKPSVVMAASNWQTALPAMSAAQKCGLPFFYEVRGFWEISRISEDPKWTESIEYRTAVYNENQIARKADQVFTLNRFMKEELVSRGVNPKKIHLVPNAFDKISDTDPPSVTRRASINYNTKYVVGYVGTLNDYEGLEDLITACASLRKDGLDLSVLIVGSSKARGIDQPSNKCPITSKLIKLSERLEFSPWLHMVANVTPNLLRDYYRAIDLIAIPRLPVRVSQLVSPLKTLEAAAFGKPMIVSNVPPLQQFAIESGAADCFIAGDVASLETSIRILLLDEKHRTALSNAGQSWVSTKRNWKEVSKIISKFVNEPDHDISFRSDFDISYPAEKGTIQRAWSKTADCYLSDTAINIASISSNREHIPLSNDVLWTEVSTNHQRLMQFAVEIEGATSEEILEKSAIVRIEFIDENTEKIAPCLQIPYSTSVGNYLYLPTARNKLSIFTLFPPEKAQAVRLGISKWHNDQPIKIKNKLLVSSLKPGVSVIVPSHKGEKTINSCLTSLAQQTLPHDLYEIVLVINGERDDSLDIINKIRQETPSLNLQLHIQEEASVGKARNLAISLAKFEFTTFVDDDDFVSNEFLESLYRNANSETVSLSRIIDFQDGVLRDNWINRQIRNASTKASINYHDVSSVITMNACKLAPTVLIKQFAFDTTLRSGEDVDYWTRFFVRNQPNVRITPDLDHAIYYRRIRPNSVSRQGETFDFNVVQRLAVIERLDQLLLDPLPQQLKNFTLSKIRAQANFIINYLKNNESKYLEFQGCLKRLNRPLNFRLLHHINDNISKDLVISYCFPPYIDTAGVVTAKRIREFGKPTDVIYNKLDKIRTCDLNLTKLADDFLGSVIEVETAPSFSNWKAMEQFVDAALNSISSLERKRKYRSVYSRAMWPASHFAAAAYKAKNPLVHWVAEFSDPLLLDIHGKQRSGSLNRDWLKSSGILDILSILDVNIPADDNLFHWCEYLPYALADEIIFTNENQRRYMLQYLEQDDLRKKALQKSKVKAQPTLPASYYELLPHSYELNESKINLAYFGSFYATRGLTEVFEAIRLLPSSKRGLVKIHIFTEQQESININTDFPDLIENIQINGYVGYFEFLNLTKKFDYLIVNDALTKGIKSINPYLPSKVSDYLGSGTDIWALCEEGSIISRLAIKNTIRLASSLGNVHSHLEILNKMILRGRRPTDSTEDATLTLETNAAALAD